MLAVMKFISDLKTPGIPLAQPPVPCFIANALHLSDSPMRSFPWRFFAALLAGLYLCLSLAAADHALHRSLHADAGQPGHQCVLTLLGQGQVDVEPPAVASVRRVEMFASTLPSTEPLPAPLCRRLPPSRGPPAV